MDADVEGCLSSSSLESHPCLLARSPSAGGRAGVRAAQKPSPSKAPLDATRTHLPSNYLPHTPPVASHSHPHSSMQGHGTSGNQILRRRTQLPSLARARLTTARVGVWGVCAGTAQWDAIPAGAWAHVHLEHRGHGFRSAAVTLMALHNSLDNARPFYALRGLLAEAVFWSRKLSPVELWPVAQVRFCQHRFSPTGELGYRGAVVGDRSTVQAYLIVEIIRFYC